MIGHFNEAPPNVRLISCEEFNKLLVNVSLYKVEYRQIRDQAFQELIGRKFENMISSNLFFRKHPVRREEVLPEGFGFTTKIVQSVSIIDHFFIFAECHHEFEEAKTHRPYEVRLVCKHCGYSKVYDSSDCHSF